ncbi:MAG: GHKL domain-containing protein [Lachnospiraceae bacterium]|nr:GHKL domain-containing protein [Lachnospiraceae bacterium]
MRLTRTISILLSFPTAFFLYGAIRTLIIVSEKRLKRLLLFSVCLMLSEIVIFFGDFYNILPVFALFLFVIHFTCKGTFYKKTAIALLFFSTGISFNALRDNCLTNPYLKLEQYEKSMLISSFSSLFFYLFLFLETRIFAPDKDYELSDSMWKLLTLLTIPPFCTVFCLVLLYDVSFWNVLSRVYRFHRDYAALLVISIFSFIGLLWTITILARQQKLEQQHALADINHHYYEAMEQQYFEIRRLKHDMANHLQVLSALPAEEQQRYLEDLSRNPALTQTLHYCGDATVNAVLTTKENQLKRCGIQLAYTIDIQKELPFDPTDICALFANALDNAAEACRKAENEDKKITLESRVQKGLFCLKITNPVGGDANEIKYHASKINLTTRDGSAPATTKPDKASHGLGLKSMREIVLRYQGEMELKSENGTAELFLYMPLCNG